MTVPLSIQQYPFVNDSKAVLSKLNITFEKIDTSNVFDEILNESFNDIIDATTRKKLEVKSVIKDIENSSFEREVAKFYLSLMIIKPSTILTRMFIRYYVNKFQIIVNYYTNRIAGGDIIIIPYYLLLFKEFGIIWKVVKITDDYFIKTTIDNYLDFETLIGNNDPPEYQILKLVNCTVSAGYVYFSIKDQFDFQRMLNKLLEERIRNLVNNIEENIECTKIDKCRNHLNKYMKDKEGLSYHPNPQKLEYGEITNSDLLRNEDIIKTFKEFLKDERYISILEFQIPPCITAILEQIRVKQELIHTQNILLATYLGAKGFTFEQITEVFKSTVNYNERVASYNIKYVLNKKLKPQNCRNLVVENLCNKQNDKTNQCEHLKNPLVFKGMINKK